MTDRLAEPAGGTPLTDEERQGLQLPVLTRDELNRGLRRDYIAALQAADADGDFQPLLTFSRR
jgi:hypothetical protein